MAGTCVADCTPEGGECGAGASCNSFGMCVPLDDAGSMPDAFVPPLDAFLSRPDVGADAPVDATADARLCTAEVPTPSVRGAVPTDEDCDGSIDEGAGWFFGRPQFLTTTHVAVTPGQPNYNLSPRLSADGLSLYFGATEGFAPMARQGLFVSRRTTVSSATPGEGRFGAPEPLVGANFDEFQSLGVPALTADELEGWFPATPNGMTEVSLYRATRPDRTAPFGPLELVPALSRPSAVEEVVELSADGLEIIVPSGRVLYHSVRTDTSSPFGTMTRLASITDAEVVSPSLSSDGRTLFYYGRPVRDGRPYQIYRASRTGAHDDTFGPATAVMDLVPPGNSGAFYPYYSERTREIFFASDGGGESWTATAYGFYRAQVCRDGPCSNAEIACPAPDVRSADGLHCYRAGAGLGPWDIADGSCGGMTSPDGALWHLATVHSHAEASVVWGLRGAAAGVILGGSDLAMEGTYAWDSASSRLLAEPFTYWTWETGEPNGTGDCLALYESPGDGDTLFGLDDADCAGANAYVCEGERWPTW